MVTFINLPAEVENAEFSVPTEMLEDQEAASPVASLPFKSSSLEETRDWLQSLLRHDGPFFDQDLVLRGCIDVKTLQPFTKEWADTQTQPLLPEPYAVDYVAGTTYEDTWDSMGNYLEYLIARHEVTAEPELLIEIRRVTQMAIDVFREDNPEDDTRSEWLANKGFFRRLYAGRYGKWPYPETLGTDQMAPLTFGLLQARPLLDDETKRKLDGVLVDALKWYMRRHFTYIYRGTLNHSIEAGPHAMSYYVPALVWAYKVTGEQQYLKAFDRLHEDYHYNPDFYLSSFEMPYIDSLPAPGDGPNNIIMTYRWSNWVPWLAVNAPNANYYGEVFDQVCTWNTRLLHNVLPSGLGHDYDNLSPTTAAYPEEWIDQPLTGTLEIAPDGFDVYAPLIRARMIPFRKLREHSYFAQIGKQIGRKVDYSPLKSILSCCTDPEHFTYWYDPEDNLVPPHMNHRTHAMQAQFVTSWLATYYRLVKLGAIEA